MSLIIKNIDTVAVELDDLGIRLEIGGDYDLAEEQGNIIAGSNDLISAIQASKVIVLDPLDGITQLTLAQSVEVIQIANDSPFRIRGGELSQLNDVTSDIPSDNEVLTYNTSIQKWEPQPGGSGGSTPTCFPFFLANGTQDNILVTGGQFPFFRADGTQDNITIEIC